LPFGLAFVFSFSSVGWAQGRLGTGGRYASLRSIFWKSAERIGTRDAYRAYLERFPSGLYAALARAAIKTVIKRSGSGERTYRGRPAGDVLDASTINGRRRQTGDRLVGPGPITVGWAGSKSKSLFKRRMDRLAVVDHKHHARLCNLPPLPGSVRWPPLIYAADCDFQRTRCVSNYSTWAKRVAGGNQEALLQIAGDRSR
jgi:hypothetical protein